jgi:putative membrane protein
MPPPERPDLAETRTVLAAERTLMAWIRTSLSMISFGFAIYKFLHGLEEAATIRLRHTNDPRDLGLILTALGTGSLIAGVIEYVQTLRRIQAGVHRLGSAFYISGVVVILGMLMFMDMAFRMGPR